MAPKKNPNPNPDPKGKKRKYRAHGKPVKKGSYPLRPGVQGFLITCEGGRERQATREALNLLDTFYEELVHGKESNEEKPIPKKPLNTKIVFEESDSSSDEDENPEGEELNNGDDEDKDKAVASEKQPEGEELNNGDDEDKDKAAASVKQPENSVAPQVTDQDTGKKEVEEEPTSKKQRLEVLSQSGHNEAKQSKGKSIDELIDEELKELADRTKRQFVSLDSGCNGVIFIQMHKRAGDPGPVDIVQHMMSSAASTRKHMSRFILRVLPVETTCYASEEEIKKATSPLLEQYFPKEAPSALKFAVLYEARANTGVDRMKIINAVAKSVPEPHKVNLSSPDKTIVVQIAKTICLVGVVERYKELAKYNLRELTSPKE